MTELNKDGLAIGKPVSFEDMMRVQREHYKAGQINAGKKRSVRRSKKPSVSDVPKTEETKEAEAASGAIGLSEAE